MHYPEELQNQSHVNDPVVTDLLVRQRRTVDPARRREILAELQRHLARQQYYVQLLAGEHRVWDGALKNYGPEPRLRLRRSVTIGMARTLTNAGRRLREDSRPLRPAR